MNSHVSYNLNSLKGFIQGLIIGVTKGDTGSSDYGLCVALKRLVTFRAGF